MIAKHISTVTGEKMSGRQWEKAAAVVDAARAEPEKFGKIAETMDNTNRVNGAFKQVKVARQAEQIRQEAPALPRRGPYRVIVVSVVTTPPALTNGDASGCQM